MDAEKEAQAALGRLFADMPEEQMGKGSTGGHVFINCDVVKGNKTVIIQAQCPKQAPLSSGTIILIAALVVVGLAAVQLMGGGRQ